MGFWKHDTEFFGKTFYDFTDSLLDVGTHVPRVAQDYDDPQDTAVAKVMKLVADPLAEHLEAMSVGMWDAEMFDQEPSTMLETLIAAAPQLPSLKALFWGDITSEECEISWIQQTDISALLDALPKLECLRVRGTNNLSLGRLKMEHLKTLIVESGGLGHDIVDEICNGSLPSLEHLEVYFGDGNYGADCTLNHAKQLMSAEKFPNVTHLGLRNATFADEIAEAVVESDIFPQLSVLDLSLGTLSDRGGKALLNSGKLAQLDQLILDHHYLSSAVFEELDQLEDVHVSLEDAEGETAEDDRYVSVSE